jgi:hypothetical protein
MFAALSYAQVCAVANGQEVRTFPVSHPIPKPANATTTRSSITTGYS